MKMENRKGEIKLRQLPQTKQLLKLIGRVKLANLIEISEGDFTKIIKKIESKPLFKRLFSPSNPQEKVISYRRFPWSELSKRFYELKEDMAVDRSSPDIVPLLDSRKKIVPIIKGLGIDKFKKYFLYSDGELSYKDISLACNLQEKEVMEIMALIDDFSIYNEFFNPSMINPGGSICYSKVAKIEKEDSGDFVINFFSPHIAKGRYWINYEKLAEMKKKEVFSQTELKKIGKLINTLEAINMRKSIIYRIIKNILEKQSIYLTTANPGNLIPLTQRELAKRINTDPSLISRAIGRRSIETPWGEEYPLKYFFPSKKTNIKGLISDIINGGKCMYTDEEIKRELKRAFNIDISRRSVASYRKELKIPTSSERIKTYRLR